MKKLILYSTLLFVSTLFSCKNAPTGIEATVVDRDLQYNEGNVFWGENLLISNFGGSELDPMNQNHKGYIVSYTGDRTTVIVAPDSLNAPKGMAVSGNTLFIADVNTMWVYALDSIAKSPRGIRFPQGDLFVNDIVIKDGKGYVSVTNTGIIYTFDVATPDSLRKFVTLPGANGLVFAGDDLYAASYPADGNITDSNVIYKISNIQNPVAEKVITLPGQYDGLAFSEKTNRLYYTNWTGVEVGYIDLNNNNMVPLTIKNYTFGGPADASFRNGKLYVCDLANSKLVILPVE